MTDPVDDFENTARDFKLCCEEVLETQRNLLDALSEPMDPEQHATLQSKLGELASLHRRLETIESQLRESNEHLKASLSEARTDPLTKLPNRRAFDEVLEANLQDENESDACSVLALIDVDFFKSINDESGHVAGDEVLIKVAHTLRSFLDHQWFVARYGGDEFAILSHQSQATFVESLESIRKANADETSEPTDSPSPVNQTTISVGVCSLQGIKKKTHALQSADAALLHAKRSGKNRICVNNRDGITKILPRTP